jgi:hypothetical protein
VTSPVHLAGVVPVPPSRVDAEGHTRVRLAQPQARGDLERTSEVLACAWPRPLAEVQSKGVVTVCAAVHV